jgi:hypothetical protein
MDTAPEHLHLKKRFGSLLHQNGSYERKSFNPVCPENGPDLVQDDSSTFVETSRNRPLVMD